MRIGIDGSCLANRRGFGRFARELTQALAEANSAHDFVVFVDRPSAEQVTVPPAMETVLVEVRVAPSVAASATGRRSVRDMLAMGRAVARGHLDAIYFPASYSFFPVWNAGQVVVTMHDTLALTHSDWVFPNGRGRLAWRLKEHAALRWADRIVTVSEASRRELASWYHLARERIHVITEGPNATFSPLREPGRTTGVLAQYGVDARERFLLYVGGLSPHKNLERLILAFGRSRIDHPGTHLVIVGDFSDVFHTHGSVLRDLVQRLGLQTSVHFTGYVPDENLAHFYRHAYAVVQPSLMEGFGLPAVEAMTSGTPVLSSLAGSLPEVVGEAGIFFDPYSLEAIGQAIHQILGDPAERDRLGRLALIQARRFTWARSALLLLDCFDSLNETRPRWPWKVRSVPPRSGRTSPVGRS